MERQPENQSDNSFFLFLSSVNDSAPSTPAHVSHWSYGTSTSSETDG